MLEAALRMQDARQLKPPMGVRSRVRNRLARQIQSSPRRPVHLAPRLAMGLAGFSLAILGATTAFAKSALPGETLYSWKLSTERAWRATSSDPLATDFSLADRRADELVSLAKRGNHNERSEQAESLGISEYNLVLDRLSQEAGERQQSEELQIALKKHQKSWRKPVCMCPGWTMPLNTATATAAATAGPEQGSP
jgi:hypothetical protein